jgi:hypothetical protein
MLTKHKEATIGFSTLEIENKGSATPLIALRQAMTAEPYTPSSFHALRGYRTLGLPVAVLLGIATLLICALAALFAPKDRRFQTGILILLCGMGLYQLRFSVDLLRFTNQHMHEFEKGTYDEAGSVSGIADVIQEIATPTSTVFVCRNQQGANFREKLLRYFSYPIRISSEAKDAALANYAIVLDATEWSLTTMTENGASVQKLVCGSLKRTAQRLTSFPDGSILFKLP